MALEDLTGASKFIDDLVETNPTGADGKSQGDDHIRGIKNVLLNTFPSLTGAVTATQAELNLLDGITTIVSTVENSDVKLPTAGAVVDAIAAQTSPVLTTPDINSPDIDGGTIDNTTIGATTPSSGKFTIIDVDNINVNNNNISSTSGNLNIIPVAGSYIAFDSNWKIDANYLVGISAANSYINAYAGYDVVIEGVIFDGGAITSCLYLTVDNITINGAVISSDTGAISFSNENLSTTGSMTASGGFVGTLTGSITGNAATATALQNTRTINGVNFNGTGNITVEPYISDDDTGDTNCPIVFTQNSTAGFKRLYEDSEFYFDNTNNILHVPRITVSTEIQAANHKWVSFSGDTRSINNSYEVSSVSDGGTGIYTINFTNAFASSSFAGVGMSAEICFNLWGSSKATTYQTVRALNPTNCTTYGTPSEISFIAIGDN